MDLWLYLIPFTLFTILSYNPISRWWENLRVPNYQKSATAQTVGVEISSRLGCFKRTIQKYWTTHWRYLLGNEYILQITLQIASSLLENLILRSWLHAILIHLNILVLRCDECFLTNNEYDSQYFNFSCGIMQKIDDLSIDWYG